MTDFVSNWVQTAFNAIHPVYSSQKNHGVPEHWVAGLIRVECASLNPKARRFESGVYKAIIEAKNALTPKSFPGFASGELGNYIKSSSDYKNLQALSTSYGLGQIMGYHYFQQWGLKPDQFSNLTFPESLDYTLQMMASFMQKQNLPYENLLRWWNTGDPFKKEVNGKPIETTYDPNYIANATRAANLYLKLLT